MTCSMLAMWHCLPTQISRSKGTSDVRNLDSDFFAEGNMVYTNQLPVETEFCQQPPPVSHDLLATTVQAQYNMARNSVERPSGQIGSPQDKGWPATAHAPTREFRSCHPRTISPRSPHRIQPPPNRSNILILRRTRWLAFSRILPPIDQTTNIILASYNAFSGGHLGLFKCMVPALTGALRQRPYYLSRTGFTHSAVPYGLQNWFTDSAQVCLRELLGLLSGGNKKLQRLQTTNGALYLRNERQLWQPAEQSLKSESLWR